MKYNVIARNKKNDIQKQVNRQQMDRYSVRNCINPVQYKEKSSNTLTTYPPMDKRNEP